MSKQTSKKRLRRGVIGLTVLSGLFLPVSVYASLQPIDLGSIDEQPQPAGAGSDSNSPQQWLPKVPVVLSATKSIFRNISGGNFDGAVRGVLGILGDLGLLDPAAESARVGSAATSGRDSSGNPYSNPQTPKQVYELERHLSIVRSELPQKLSQIVFGPQGQQALANQDQVIAAAQQASLESQQGVAQSYQVSAQQAKQNVSFAQSVDAQAKKAQAAKASQDVLKAVAAQNADLANIGAGTSAQLSELGKAASFQSTQLSAANTQLAALNDKSQVLQVLSASQNYQASQLNAAIDHQNHYQQSKDSIATEAASQASSMVYIPGLLPKEAVR